MPTIPYSVDGEYSSDWTYQFGFLAVLLGINLIVFFTYCGLLAVAITIMRGGGLNILVALSVASRNLRPIAALAALYFLASGLYLVILVAQEPADYPFVNAAFMITIYASGAATLFALVHLADRGGGLLGAIGSSLRLTRAAWRDSAIYFITMTVVYLGGFKLFEMLPAPPSSDDPSIFGDNANILLFTVILIPFTTFSAIYLARLDLFARGREMERAAAASA